MEYFAGLDVSMAETHVCVMNRDGAVTLEVKVPSTPADIAAALAQAPACERIVFETGRMAPMLFHGLGQLGLPIVCIESRQAYQALKSLATHKTDRNDARGLAHLARTGFFKPVSREVAVGTRCPLADHRSQEAGRAAGHSGEPDPRACRGVRRATTPCAQPAFIKQALQASEVFLACLPPCGVLWRRVPPCSVPSWRSTRT